MGISVSTMKKSKPVHKSEQKKPSKQKKKRDLEELLAMEDNEDEVDSGLSSFKSVKEVEVLGPFQGGLVHPVIKEAVPVFYRKTSESSLFNTMMWEFSLQSGTFFGSLYSKTSFVAGTGGKMLL